MKGTQYLLALQEKAEEGSQAAGGRGQISQLGRGMSCICKCLLVNQGKGDDHCKRGFLCFFVQGCVCEITVPPAQRVNMWAEDPRSRSVEDGVVDLESIKDKDWPQHIAGQRDLVLARAETQLVHPFSHYLSVQSLCLMGFILLAFYS